MAFSSSSTTFIVTLACLLLFAGRAHGFGAGNIASLSKIEGANWRHGDLEDTLLTLLISRAAGGKHFSKMDVARVYFGNWLRDYSQALDVGTLKYVSSKAIQILLWVLGFVSFGYGTKEFEATEERIGVYRPEEHIDNPKDYADNLDAREYDPRLRGPVDEEVELAIDPKTGMKRYIASESEEHSITTSAGHVRQLFNECIRLGRRFARTGNKADLHEALRLLGSANHTLEDFSAHSNYVEAQMGERETFPHVGRRTQIQIDGVRGSVYPLVTGTFGGVDFLHSVCGEFSDKATQSEIQELAGTMQEGSRTDTSLLKDLLNKLPSGLLGGGDPSGKADELQANATAAQMQNLHVTPKQPEAFTRQMDEIIQQIYPIIQWHDEILSEITDAIAKIPVIPEMIEQVTEQINVFVFSLLAPFVVPIINQVQNELQTGSSEVIASSKDKQLIVFNDDHSTDPTHSMLSKDHFSNVLNEVAGKVASQVLKWVVPQIISCWDDERIDATRTVDRIINGVLHHPAQRNLGEDNAVDGRRLMFQIVENWWGSKSQTEKENLRRQLSRKGVESGDNHAEGVHDTGHGCGKPLGMAKATGSGSGGASTIMGALSGSSSGQSGGRNEFSQFAEEAVGGGALGGIVGALAGGVGASLLGNVFGNKEKKAYSQEGFTAGGGFQQSYTEYGKNPNNNETAQARVEQTTFPSGVQRTEYERYEQSATYGGSKAGYGYEVDTERRPMPGGGYEESIERKYERPGEEDTEVWREGRTADGRHYQEIKHHKSHHSGSESEDEYKLKHHGKHHKKKKSSSSEEEDRPQQYQPPREESRAYGEQEYGRQSYGGERERFEEPSRQEFSGGYGGGRERFEESRQESTGGYGGGRERFQEPPRQEFGGGRGERGFQEPRFEAGGFRREQERFEEPRREEFGGGRGFEGGFGGERNELEQERQEEELREEFQEEQREEYQEEGYGERRRW